MQNEENRKEPEIENETITYDFRGLGLGEISGIIDRLKMLATGVHDVADYHKVWEYIQTPNDIFANMNMMLVYSHDAMRSDFNEKGEIEPVMHDELTKFGVTEINLATMMLNILDLGTERNLRLPAAMLAVYEYRVRLIQEELTALKEEAESEERH